MGKKSAKQPLGYTCPCGKFHRADVWAAAHWDKKLQHHCDKCGKDNWIQSGYLVESDEEVGRVDAEIMKKRGGDWRFATRLWIKGHVPGFRHRRWGKSEQITITIEQLEDCAAHAAAAVMNSMEKGG